MRIESHTIILNPQNQVRRILDAQAHINLRGPFSDQVIDANQRDASKALTVRLSGQVETMRESYTGLFTGIGLAIVLVYLFLVMNFQSWIDPLIVLMAVPVALAAKR